MQLKEFQAKQLEKQQYRLVGNHSAVKVCHWTKKMIKNEGGCYKFVFYGIRSHQCMQMTTSMFCANRCTFCWRGQKAPVSEEWYGPVDEPGWIIDEALKKHMSLLAGMGGNDKVPPKMMNAWKDVRHVALSLTGEPITYPRIEELLDEFHKRRASTFLVTNAQYPEQIEKIKKITQLYISVDAPSRDMLKEIDRPLFGDYYERLIKSLEAMSRKKFRRAIRLTIIKGKNDVDVEGYKKLIELGSPDFIEVKGYVHVGFSVYQLKKENMPYHDYVLDFSKKLKEVLPGYEIVSEHKPSRVVLLIKKEAMPYRFIDFQKFFELASASEHVDATEYGSTKMMPN
ncbi:4-demethylwyosine synthase TYW1 [Candidatus Woesearchaeota archaeon]|nr:4-demethylwyosine synthase TYW1 [Candidatus Woesearchaeota archaeon]